jgi:hypothetical protein
MDWEDRLVKNIQATVACFSLVGEIFVILCYLVLIPQKTFRLKLICCLMLANLVATVSDLMIFYNNSSFICVVEGTLRTFGELSAILWVMVIARVSYKEILEPFENREALFNRYLFQATAIPGIIASM